MTLSLPRTPPPQCPQCGGTDIVQESAIDADGRHDGWPFWVCRPCNRILASPYTTEEWVALRRARPIGSSVPLWPPSRWR